MALLTAGYLEFVGVTRRTRDVRLLGRRRRVSRPGTGQAADLLADARAAAPEALLGQVQGRADFLLGATRAVAAVQHPRRALEALVVHLLDGLVDLVEVTVRNGAWELAAAGSQGSAPRSLVRRRGHEPSPSALEEAIRRGVAEDVSLPPLGSGRAAVLSSLLQDEDLLRAADDHRVGQLAVLPLAARGRTFGTLVLGRREGLGFGGAEPFLDELVARLSVGLDALLVVAESRYVAGVLRRSLAPSEMPTIAGLDLAAFYRVAHESEEVGGDFIDVHGPADDVLLVCGDVAGKGVDAAISAKRITYAARTAALVDRRPSAILGLVNRVVVAEAGELDEELATAACVRLRRTGAEIVAHVASAGHPPTLVLRANGEVEQVAVSGLVIGLLEDYEYDETAVPLAPGDTLLMYTDGVTEARGASELFGDDRLRRALDGMAGLPARALVDAVAIAVTDHLGERAHDDIAVVAVQHRPAAP